MIYPTNIYRHLQKVVARILTVLFLCVCLSQSVQAFQQQPDSTGTKTGKTPITQRDYDNMDIEMADAWRANGKIYVVVATLGSLMVGIAFYLVILDRRIGKLEKEVEE